MTEVYHISVSSWPRFEESSCFNPNAVSYSDADRAEAVKGDHPKHQAVMSMDMATWDNLIKTFDIQEPMIRHREEESYSNVGAKGWYA